MKSRAIKPAAASAAMTTKPESNSVDNFLAAVATTPLAAPRGSQGRLIFALDATYSRAPTWDMAATLQAEMFREAAAWGHLLVQVTFFRGFRECKSSPWLDDGNALADLMARVHCRAGRTQIGRILDHSLNQNKQEPVAALVYVGDAIEENIDKLADKAGRLGLTNLPAFMFQEGNNRAAADAFREIARLSGGAYARFDAAAPGQLAALLRPAWRYAAGGHTALRDDRSNSPQQRLLSDQLRRPPSSRTPP